MKIELMFADSISEAYREKLQTFSDNILAQGLTANRPPIIWFPENDEETYIDILKLCDDYDARLTPSGTIAVSRPPKTTFLSCQTLF